MGEGDNDTPAAGSHTHHWPLYLHNIRLLTLIFENSSITVESVVVCMQRVENLSVVIVIHKQYLQDDHMMVSPDSSCD